MLKFASSLINIKFNIGLSVNYKSLLSQISMNLYENENISNFHMCIEDEYLIKGYFDQESDHSMELLSSSYKSARLQKKYSLESCFKFIYHINGIDVSCTIDFNGISCILFICVDYDIPDDDIYEYSSDITNDIGASFCDNKYLSHINTAEYPSVLFLDKFTISLSKQNDDLFTYIVSRDNKNNFEYNFSADIDEFNDAEEAYEFLLPSILLEIQSFYFLLDMSENIDDDWYEFMHGYENLDYNQPLFNIKKQNTICNYLFDLISIDEKVIRFKTVFSESHETDTKETYQFNLFDEEIKRMFKYIDKYPTSEYKDILKFRSDLILKKIEYATVFVAATFGGLIGSLVTVFLK